jgi:BatD DUF11 like domain
MVTHFIKILLGWITLSLAILSISQAAEVTAQLDRDSVAVGNGAVLTLEITGDVLERPEIPEVPDLIVESQSQSRRIQIINGITTTTVSYTYAVGSQVPGDYEVPAIPVTVDGQDLSSQPLKLRVLEAGAGQPPAGIPATPQGQQPPEPAEETGEKRFGFLTVELANTERKHAYVGEIAPVRIRAWLPAGAQAELGSSIQPEAKGFTLHNVSSQPQQTREERDGKLYTVITWFAGMSATKAGKLPASLSVDAVVAVRDTTKPRPQRRRTGGPFDDPFFDSAFDRMSVPMIQKKVTLKSEDQEIEVRPLPTEGRPLGFTGAVGEFKFDSAEIPNAWKTGEPQQITTQLSGSGNFALMKAPSLTPEEIWKSYPGKDEFTPGDQASFSGSKIFQFSAVARKGGAQNAALEFSYFDPIAETYKTIAQPARKIQVSGNDLVETAQAAAPEVKEPEKKPDVKMVGQQDKLSAQGLLVPLVSRRAFTEMLVTAGGLAGLGLLIGGFRIRRDDPKRQTREALEKATREALAAAASATDIPRFFAAARLAIQHRLGSQWGQSAQAITSAEIQARVAADSPVARFFQEADHYEYNRQGSGEILPRWRSLLQEAVASLTSSNP